MLVSGALLPQRGAVIPALASIGLTKEETQRTWAAFRGGVWRIQDLLGNWQGYVKELPGWEEHRYEGYLPIPVDLTGFWRPTLEGLMSKHYHPVAERALPAVLMGIIGEGGEIGGQRLVLPRAIERATTKVTTDKGLWEQILKKLAKDQPEDEIIVVDAGVKIRELQDAGIKNYEGRQAKNFTARRNYLPEYKGHGRKSEYGDIVRPLARTRKGKTIEATAPDDIKEHLVACVVS